MESSNDNCSGTSHNTLNTAILNDQAFQKSRRKRTDNKYGAVKNDKALKRANSMFELRGNHLTRQPTTRSMKGIPDCKYNHLNYYCSLSLDKGSDEQNKFRTPKISISTNQEGTWALEANGCKLSLGKNTAVILKMTIFVSESFSTDSEAGEFAELYIPVTNIKPGYRYFDLEPVGKFEELGLESSIGPNDLSIFPRIFTFIDITHGNSL
ncbi:hypothetical protein BB560_002077 [Smittium megazygosporum]|uniref:Uncharacterized protein n=1 Tax=Smittium megazygosporum TaxID=133381 RepID=A0A2T9ZFU4_9FUNG|nr:hypothetical protein BB560_002077 [Smittium megazygosporum]